MAQEPDDGRFEGEAINDDFSATDAGEATEQALLIGIVGPPGGGKTLSALKIAAGMQKVRGGDIIVIDTEGGRSRKYASLVPFKIVELAPPYRSSRFLKAIKAQVASNPAAIVVDSLSDEHEGEGGFLEYRDEMVPRMGGNEWAAWAKPKAERKRLTTGILNVKVPLIFTFRAREKTKQEGKKVMNIGYVPVAPVEIVHTLDLTCILPPRANGVPVWHSEKIGEDFIVKLPHYLQPYIDQEAPLSEETGEALAKWQKGQVESAAAREERLWGAAREAAARGKVALQAHWKGLEQSDRRVVKQIMDELTATAKAADEAANPSETLSDDPFEASASRPPTTSDVPPGNQVAGTEAAGAGPPPASAAPNPADAANWTLEEGRAHGAKSYARGMSRPASIPPTIRNNAAHAALVDAILDGFDTKERESAS